MYKICFGLVLVIQCILLYLTIYAIVMGYSIGYLTGIAFVSGLIYIIVFRLWSDNKNDN